MSREVHTAWREFHADVDTLLARARKELCIWDEDLSELGLASPERHDRLSRLLVEYPTSRIRIVLRNVQRLEHEHPRLLMLLKHHGHQIRIWHAASSILRLRDTLLLADRAHLLVRHERQQPRSTLILDDPEEVAPWQKRFEDICAEGGEAVTPTILGL